MVDEERTACACHPLPRGKGMAFYHPQALDRRVAGAMEEGQGRCAAAERSPGKGMVCGLQRDQERCMVGDLPRGLGTDMARER